MHVGFPDVDTTSDSLISIGTSEFCTPIAINNLISNNSQWWIEPDINNVPVLCTRINDDEQLQAIFEAAGLVETQNFLGGRPPVHK